MAEAHRAAEEVASGEVGRSSRPWLAAVALAAGLGFALDSYAVATLHLLPFDVPVSLFVQQLPWGPLTLVMETTNALAGVYQVLLGLAAIVLLALVDRRAGWLMAVGSVARLLDNLFKLAKVEKDARPK